MHPGEHLLLCDGQAVALTPKVFELLRVLVENGGHLVEKDELMTAVWPDSFVEEANLTVNMSALRKALGDQPSGRPYIETVPKGDPLRDFRPASRDSAFCAEGGTGKACPNCPTG
jgi:DNA-binding winged helix-turn-helix (wHTH) protein